MKCPNCHREITSSLASKCPHCGYPLTPDVYQKMDPTNSTELDPNLSQVNPDDTPHIWYAVLAIFVPIFGIIISRSLAKKPQPFTRKVYNICTMTGLIMYTFIILMIVALL